MIRDNKGEFGVIAAYIAVCILWGSTYLAMRVAVTNFPPELFAGIRFSLAGIIVLIFAIAKKKVFPANIKEVATAAVPGLFMLLGANGLVMYAEQWVHSGIASLLLSTTPLFVGLIETFIFKDTNIKLFGWCCLVVGFVSTAMLIMAGVGIGSTDIKGGLIVLLAAFFWSCGSIFSKKVKLTGHITTQIGIQMLAAGLCLLIVGVSLGEVSQVNINLNAVLAMIYLVVFGSIIGYSSNMYVLNKWPASRAITSAYINPVVAVILGAVILGEKFNIKMVLFMILTLGSVILIHMNKYGILKGKINRFKNPECRRTNKSIS